MEFEDLVAMLVEQAGSQHVREQTVVAGPKAAVVEAWVAGVGERRSAPWYPVSSLTDRRPRSAGAVWSFHSRGAIG